MYNIPNSGQILLCPFLPTLFEQLGLLGSNRFKSAGDSIRAVSILNYISNGSESLPDDNNLLNKLLCNVSFDTEITSVNISAEERKEADSLLHSVICHWKALGNTSIEGLRKGFIKRDGLLDRKESDTLIIRRRSIDLLLDSLPWSISPVKLPWMDRVLSVIW